MIENSNTRAVIAEAIGSAVDGLVRDRMEGLVEEPDVTSRIAQRLEDRFDDTVLEGYRIRVITETIPSHGPNSLEKPMGADLYLAVSVEAADGTIVSKGIFVQAKRSDKLNWPELTEQCRRMNLVTKKGSVVWLYKPTGMDVLRSRDVVKTDTDAVNAATFFNQVLECQIGDQRKAPAGAAGDRAKLKAMLKTIGAENAVWLKLEETGSLRPGRKAR
jgi:hypothetical protein